MEQSISTLVHQRIVSQLTDVENASLDRLFEAISTTEIEPQDELDSIARFGVTALNTHMNNSEASPVELRIPPEFPWIQTAQALIMRYVQSDPDQRSILMNSVFFTKDDRLQRSLHALVFGSIPKK